MSEFLIKSAGILFFVLISFLMQRANLERQIRNRQFLMPLFAVVYVLITAFYIHHISGYFMDIFDEVIMNILFNVVAAIVYIPYKKIIVAILEIIFRKNNFFHDRAVDRFYEYFPEKSVWCLKEGYVQARKLAGIVWYSSVVLLSAIMVISEKMYESGMLVNMFYPVFSVILIGEVYAFLGGASKTEYLREILGENENRQSDERCKCAESCFKQIERNRTQATDKMWKWGWLNSAATKFCNQISSMILLCI